MHANNETGVDLSHRAALAADEGDRSGDHLPYRRDAIGRQGADRSAPRFPARRYALVLRPQGPAPKGIGALYIKRGTPMPAVHDRRASGGGPPGRHGKRALYRRHGQGPAIGGRGVPGRGHVASAACAIGWSGRSSERMPSVVRQRPRRYPAAQHAERLLPLRRRRGDALPLERFRDLRLQRLGLHLRVARALACVAGDESARGRRPRLRPLQPQPLQHRRRRGPHHRGLSRDRCEPAPASLPIGIKRRTPPASVRKSWSIARNSPSLLLALVVWPT